MKSVKPLEDVYEPYLLQEGFIQRTLRGRSRYAELSFEHFGQEYPEDKDGEF